MSVDLYVYRPITHTDGNNFHGLANYVVNVVNELG